VDAVFADFAASRALSASHESGPHVEHAHLAPKNAHGPPLVQSVESTQVSWLV
jgi:hypothetical protein